MGCVITVAHPGLLAEGLSNLLVSTNGHEHILRPHLHLRKTRLWTGSLQQGLESRIPSSLPCKTVAWLVSLFPIPTPSHKHLWFNTALCSSPHHCYGMLASHERIAWAERPRNSLSGSDTVPWALALGNRTKSSQDYKPFQPNQRLWPLLFNILLLFEGYEV